MILRIKRKTLLVALIAILAVSLFTVLRVFSPLPQKASVVSSNVPSRYVIDTSSNSFPKQGRNQCSAFSSAFILRQLGHDAYGDEIYENISGKIMIPPWKGYVFYTGIIKLFESYGYNINIYVGDLSALYSSLTNGVPIIVQIGNGLKWQHYMVLIGYDKNLSELYFYDSNKRSDTNESDPGNRTLSETEFLKLWNNKTPFFNRSYYVIEN